jgi:acetyl/propionyl-CoA carboxylase alpha subunit
MHRILIANRGEIAVRLIHTIKKMGIEAVAIYHHQERNALHTRLADIAIEIGNGTISETFLNIHKIIEIAINQGCDAIHPGYGFLSENYHFAEACELNGIAFIGPSAKVIQQMGSKSRSKTIAQRAGVPFPETIHLNNENSIPQNLNFPVLIKAALGGGGKGMKIVRHENDFPKAFESAKREALTYFNDDKLLVEPYIENARHIEVQVLADNFGNVAHLSERECSIQRNHQKIIEEAPAVSISEVLRNQLHLAAIRIAKEVGYTNAGTVEFLVSDKNFYFLEMNTRIQVEHPVTEAITGIDIVAEQINIAQNLPLSEKLKALKPNGHAIEVRICAENPAENFRPSTGIIDFIDVPKNHRFDSFLEHKTTVGSLFDSMLGKLIVHAKSRQEAIVQLQSALKKTSIHGIETNISYLSTLVSDRDFKDNRVSTDFISKHHARISEENKIQKDKIPVHIPIAIFIYNRFLMNSSKLGNLWKYAGVNYSGKFVNIDVDGKRHKIQIQRYSESSISFFLNGKPVNASVLKISANELSIKIDGEQFDGYYTRLTKKPADIFETDSHQFKLSSPEILSMAEQYISKKTESSDIYFNQIVSPLFGKVIDIKVKQNDKVRKGDILLTIESMKTENHILSPGKGIVNEVKVKKGSQVEENCELITLNPLIENEHSDN